MTDTTRKQIDVEEPMKILNSPEAKARRIRAVQEMRREKKKNQLKRDFQIATLAFMVGMLVCEMLFIYVF